MVKKTRKRGGQIISKITSLNALTDNLAKVREQITLTLDDLCEHASNVSMRMEEIADELEANSGKVSEMVKSRFEKLYEGGDDSFDLSPIIDSYQIAVDTMGKARGLHTEIDSVVGDVESLSERLTEVHDQGEALIK